MRRLLLTAVAAATVAAGPGAALALAHSGEHHHHHEVHVRRHNRTEHFGGIPGAPAGATGATGVSGPVGPQLPPPETAGMVASFTNGVLTIKLNDGTTVTGTITDATRLGCESLAGRQDDRDGDRNDNDGNGDNRGSNNGSGGGDSGSNGGGGGWSGGGHGDDEGNGNVSCTFAAVTPGTVVAEAELQISGSGAVWDSVLLVA